MRFSEFFRFLSGIIHVWVWVIGAVLAGSLIFFFNDNQIGKENRLLGDFSVVILLTTAVVAYIQSRYAKIRRETVVWLVIGMAFVYLAMDEQFMFHERFDKWIHHVFEIRETRVTDQLDGLIIVLYAIAALGVIFVFRSVLGRQQRTFRYLTIAFIFLLSTIILDIFRIDIPIDNAYFEESAKVISEYFFLLAFLQGLPKLVHPAKHITGRGGLS